MEVLTQQHFLTDTSKRALRNTFERAWGEFPFYRSQFEKNNLSPTDDPITLLNHFPLLDTNGYLELQKDIYQRLRGSDFLTEYTSGTTGPRKIRFVTHEDEKAEEELCVRFFRQCGLTSDDRVLALDIDSPDIYLFYSRALSRIGVQSFSYFNFVDSGIVSLEPLFTYKPTVVLSIPSILERCKAQLLQVSHAIGQGNLKKILYIAENIDPELRYALTEEIGLEVFSFYGSTEIGSMAGECEKHDGIHIYNDAVIPTLIDPIDEGNYLTGKVAWTTLHFLDQPLIKYVNGDLISISKYPCSCNSKYPIMTNIRRENIFSVYGQKFEYNDFAEAIAHMNVPTDELRIVITPEEKYTRVILQLPENLIAEKGVILKAMGSIKEFAYFLEMGFVVCEVEPYSKGKILQRKINKVLINNNKPFEHKYVIKTS